MLFRRSKKGSGVNFPFYYIYTKYKKGTIWQKLPGSARGRYLGQVLLQSSQVDLLAKSEMLDGVVFDAKVVTPLGGSGGMLPPKDSFALPENFEKLK